MTVTEFNQTVAREKIIAPADAIVRIIERYEDEIKIEVLGRTTWVKARKTKPAAPKRTREEIIQSTRPSYRMDKDEIALGPSAYMLLQWIKSLEHLNFSLEYAAQELDMSVKTVRKSLQIIRSKGMMPQ